MQAEGSGWPAAIESERSLLGSALLDPSIIGNQRDAVAPSDFYGDGNRVIWSTMIDLYDRGEGVDLVTVTEALESSGRLAAAGGSGYLNDLVGVVPSPSNAPTYARNIGRMATLRRLLNAGVRIAGLAQDMNQDPEDAVRQAEALLASVLRADTGDGFVSQPDALNAYSEELRAKTSAEGIEYVIPTGLRDLDRILNGGLRRRELIVLAARPSMGKSGLGLTICTNAAAQSSAGVAIFSLEMATSSLIGRMLAYASKVPLQVVDSGRWDRYTDRLGATLGTLAPCRIWWNDVSSMTVERMRSLLRRQIAQGPIDLVLIDHAQLLHCEGRTENRVRELTTITRELKAMAKDFNVAVVLISQLSRAVEQRPNKQPLLSDLRESGSLEQDADVVLLLYREEYYKPDTERINIADVTVAKHRSGPTGVVSLSWSPQTTGFWGLENLGL